MIGRFAINLIVIAAFLTLFIIFLKSLYFSYQSIFWPLSYCIDMVLMKFFGWSLDHGLTPYIDFHTYNLPVTIYLFRIFFWIAGESSILFRMIDVFWIIIIAICSLICLWKQSKISSIIIFALVFMLPENATPFGALQRETLALPFLILGAFILKKNYSINIFSYIYIFISGFIAGAAFYIKPNFILFFIFIYSEQFIREFISFRSIARTIQSGLSFGLGFLFLSLFVFLPFIFKGVLSEAFTNWLTYFRILNASLEIIPPGKLLGDLFTFNPRHWSIAFNSPVKELLSAGHFSIFYIFIFFLYLYYNFKGNLKSLIPIFFVLTGILSYVIQGKGFSYHLFPAWFGFMMMIASILGFELENLMEKKKNPIFSIVILLIIATAVLQSQKKSQEEYKGTRLFYPIGEKFAPPDDPFSLEVVDEIIIKYGVKTMLVFEGYHSIMLNSVMKNNIKYVSKYPESYVFYSDIPETGVYKKDLMDSLKNNPPDLITMNRFGTFKVKKDLFQSVSGLNDFISSEYILMQKVKEITGVEYSLYLKKSLKK